MHAFDDQVTIPSLGQQLGLLLGEDALTASGAAGTYFSAESIDLDLYDHISILDVSRRASPMPITDEAAFIQAMQTEYNLPIIQTSGDWQLPAGAFARSGCGPS